MNQTNPRLIFVVVCAIAGLAFIGVASICFSLFYHIYADPAILTALITITSGLVGSLTSLLANTRSQSPQEGTTTQTVTTTLPNPKPTDSPQPVIITNKPDNAVPVTENPKP